LEKGKEIVSVGVTALDQNGQVLIPNSIRQRLDITPKTKLLVYTHKDTIILKKIKVNDIAADLKRIYSRIDKKIVKFGSLSDPDINSIIRKSRQKKRA
jgi:AbrB family looped-hinge helix DNA binding protein